MPDLPEGGQEPPGIHAPTQPPPVETQQAHSPQTPTPKAKRLRRQCTLGAALLLGCALLTCTVVSYRAIRPHSFAEYGHDLAQITFHPESGFRGKRITLLCMGVDDNIVVNGGKENHFGNTDTLMLLNLDLENQQVTGLSIPRDTYVHISGTQRSTKINFAYAHGGIPCAMATIKEFMGIRPDFYVVVSIAELQTLVDALGGIDVTIENAMRYDDQSGHLHIDLKPGEQHLNGEQALAFIRFRHALRNGKVIATPESGDQRRIVRQHVALRAILHRTKAVRNLIRCNSLFDTGLNCIHTDLTRVQILDLLALFRTLDPSDVSMDQLPAHNYLAPDGGMDLWVEPEDRKLYKNNLLQNR